MVEQPESNVKFGSKFALHSGYRGLWKRTFDQLAKGVFNHKHLRYHNIPSDLVDNETFQLSLIINLY